MPPGESAFLEEGSHRSEVRQPNLRIIIYISETKVILAIATVCLKQDKHTRRKADKEDDVDDDEACNVRDKHPVGCEHQNL